MTSGRGKDRSDLERTTCINATRTDCGTKLRAATCHAPGLGTAQVTRFAAGADEPYEGILHVRVCGGRRGQPRLLPGTERGRVGSVVNSNTADLRRRSVHSFGGERTPGAGSGRGGDPETLPDRFSSLIGADEISEDECRLVIYPFAQGEARILFVYFEWFAVTFPAQRDGWSSLHFCQDRGTGDF